ncbi:MAG: DUF2238 domain-containing protein [Nitrospira sp.]|nr:DUF2238 domain-containing protein [Nitrospira sp.]
MAPFRELTLLLGLTVGGLLLSGWAPADRFTWFLEALPVLIGLPLLAATHRIFPLTSLTYRLLTIHAAILLIGAHYTYAHVPIGYWMQDILGFARNHFDRIGHLAQGFVPAILAREFLLRTSPLQQGSWLFVLVCSVCLAFSACYELFEWGVVRRTGEAASAFLGTQGDEWDTQWDMFMALIGSITAQLTLSRIHDRQLRMLAPTHSNQPNRPEILKALIACIGLLTTISFFSAPAGAQSTNFPTTTPVDHPIGTDALAQERLGLFPGTAFLRTTGRCNDCRTSPQALWYFADETIAVPAHQDQQDTVGDNLHPPFLIWLGSPELITQSLLSADHTHLELPSGSLVPFRLVPQLSANRSYYNDASTEFFTKHRLRVRGRTVLSTEGPVFEARTIWPSDFLLSRDHAMQAGGSTITQLMETSSRTTEHALTTHILWERHSDSWGGKPVLAVILNGAQGDDDEAHGGHFGLVTGSMGPQGEWADWLVNNFYDPDVVSEKGILPAMVPMDNYLMDLNSGQSYYRPSEILVLILKHDRVPAAYQSTIQNIFRQLYRHEIDYDHSLSNCAGLSIDQLRALGWQIPLYGSSSLLKATGGFFYLAAKDRSFASGTNIYRYFSEEVTRLLPRVAFEAIGNDLLALLHQRQSLRGLTAFEEWLVEDVEAVLYVHIPQVPSSRATGTYAVASLDEYQQRVPADRSQWKAVPTPPRPFPVDLRVAPIQAQLLPLPTPILILVFSLVCASFVITGWLYRRRSRDRRDG